jgi:hypothetical protein
VNLSHVFAGQNVGVKQVGERVWLVTFMRYDLGYFEELLNPEGKRAAGHGALTQLCVGLIQASRCDTGPAQARCSKSRTREDIRRRGLQRWSSKRHVNVIDIGVSMWFLDDLIAEPLELSVKLVHRV